MLLFLTVEISISEIIFTQFKETKFRVSTAHTLSSLDKVTIKLPVCLTKAFANLLKT